jgi:O-antigen/teichoic acid export membrane protein/GT2 family glycosyltransferase
MNNGSLEKVESAERLIKNSIWLFVAEATAKVVGLATQIIAARYLGDEGYGNYSMAFAFSGILVVFVDLGLSIHVGKKVSRSPEQANQYLKSVLGLKKVLVLPIVSALALLVWWMPGGSDVQVVVGSIGLALVLNGFTEMYLSVFRAFEWMHLVCLVLVVQRALFFLTGYLALLMGYQVVPFSMLFLVVSALSLFLAKWHMNRRNVDKDNSIDWTLSKKILKDSLPVCGVFLCSYIYFRIDSVLIYFLLGKAETGWYNAAFKWVEVLALLVASIRAGIFPALSRSHLGNDDQFQRIGKEAIRYLILIGLPLTIGTFALAPELVQLLYGDLYAMTVQILQIMSLGFILIFINEFIIYLLLSGDRLGEVLKVVLAGSVLNITLNFLAIPKWGVNGAAAVAGITELLLFFMFYHYMTRFSWRIPFLRLFWRPVLASCFMGMVIDQTDWPLFPSMLVGALAYLLMLATLQTFNQFDIRVIKNILNIAESQKKNLLSNLPTISQTLSIIIVNYKSQDYLMKCLCSIRKYLKDVGHEIIVVDNASGKGCLDLIKEEFSEIIFLENSENIGFSRANNQGIEVSSGEYILLLNNDAEVLPGSLQTMLNVMKQSPETGLLGCLLVNPDKTIQESYGMGLGIFNEICRKYFFNKLYEKSGQSWRKWILKKLHSSALEVEWVRGACMLFQRNAIADVGLMDENYFMYFEDMDIGLSLRKRGWEVRFTPEASIIHHQGVSQSKAPHLKTMAYRKSQLYYYKKNYGQVGLRGLKAYLLLKFLSNAVVSFIYRRNENEEVVRLRREERELIRTYQ